MSSGSKNIAASRRDKLFNISRTDGRNFDFLLLLYLQERLLYRMMQSVFADRLVLKGGLLMYSVFGHISRPTRDIDWLARDLTSEPEVLAAMMRVVCGLECPDGVSFDPASVMAEEIREGANYPGVRLTLNGSLGKARKRIQLDIGFYDVVVPEPITISYPVLLEDPAPRVTVYSLESVVAEKFEAMLSLGLINSRMKDFYDISMLARHHDFEGPILFEAIVQTLRRRKTVASSAPSVFSQDFANDSGRMKMWKAFLRGVDADSLDFADMMAIQRAFLEPVYQSYIRCESFMGHWKHEKLSWG